MPPIIKVKEQNVLVDTKNFPHAKWKYPTFNPVQSRVFEFYDKDCNAIIASSTSSGKTITSELFVSHEIRTKKTKAMFIGPLKSLTQEKLDDWQSKDYHFSDLKIAIITGDYRLTKERKKELEEANIIIMTSEMLSFRCRNFTSEDNSFLKDVGVLVVDEAHKISDLNRGTHLEIALMKFTEISPNARLVMLSATMPNVNEIGEWVSYILNKKQTYVLTSDYRPCPLSIHYEKVWDQAGSYINNEKEKVNYALDIIDYYPDDKFLIFAHTIDTGLMMTKALKGANIQAEFHYSHLSKEDRVSLENRFRTDASFRCIVATSGMAEGINMPARRVIVLGVTRGPDIVESIAIKQMVGRAGRPSFDPMGDAYVLLPERTFDEHKERLKKLEPIKSHLLDELGGKYKNLAFHLVSEIHHGNVKNIDDVHKWFNRSLAHFQCVKLNDAIVDKTINDLKACFAINEENDELKATAIGKISSMFYVSPFDVSNLRYNFKNLFERNEQNDDISVAFALACIDSNGIGFANSREKEEMEDFASDWNIKFGNNHPDSIIKTGFCYYCLMNGQNQYRACSPTMRTLQNDFSRTIQILISLDSMSGKWNKFSWFRNLESRVSYGVKSHLVPLVGLKDIGKVRAGKLWDAGLRTLEQISNSPEIIQKALGWKSSKAQILADEAKFIMSEP